MRPKELKNIKFNIQVLYDIITSIRNNYDNKSHLQVEYELNILIKKFELVIKDIEERLEYSLQYEKMLKDENKEPPPELIEKYKDEYEKFKKTFSKDIANRFVKLKELGNNISMEMKIGMKKKNFSCSKKIGCKKCGYMYYTRIENYLKCNECGEKQ